MLETQEEWRAYIRRLAGPALRSKVIAANSQQFANSLLEEGKDLAYLEDILGMFVQQMLATGMKFPEGGAYDLRSLDPLIKAAKLSPEQVAALAAHPVEEPPDAVDALVATAELETAWEDATPPLR
jgi:hypothetical protein